MTPEVRSLVNRRAHVAKRADTAFRQFEHRTGALVPGTERHHWWKRYQRLDRMADEISRRLFVLGHTSYQVTPYHQNRPLEETTGFREYS